MAPAYGYFIRMHELPGLGLMAAIELLLNENTAMSQTSSKII